MHALIPRGYLEWQINLLRMWEEAGITRISPSVRGYIPRVCLFHLVDIAG